MSLANRYIAKTVFIFAVLGLLNPSFAQTFPDRPIKLIVAAAPGGNLEITSRIFADKLTEILGQSVVVEARPGASGILAARAIASATPDGYTIGAVATSFTSAPATLKDANYDPIKNYIGIGLMNWAPMVLLVSSQSKIRSMDDLIAAGKVKANKLSYASGGSGSSTHVPTALFVLRTGMDVTHVPYRGGGGKFPDLMSERITFMIDPVDTSLELVTSGKLRAIGVTTKTRLAVLPDVPSISEKAVPGFDMALWTGLIVPAGTPPAIVKRLHEAYMAAATSPDLVGRVVRNGMEMRVSKTSDEFTSFIGQEVNRFRDIIREASIPVE